ncbi:SDR family oxidoreductase [Paraconexibacter sp. AEG42_29]|uniref:SDR family oxidoreductase n=1 Tax=Paraconexibacter sp. AEG42_29 TaxID=2997339 RepID=UPI00339D5420
MDLGLQGRRALVTGASAGIAKGIAAGLVAEGARVVVSSRSQDRIAAAAADVGAVAGLVWDSDDVDAAAGLVASAGAALGGPVDVLVASTGGPPAGADPLAFTREQWEAAHRTLVLAPLALLTAVLPSMRAQGWGRVVNVASTSVREPLPYLMLSTAERSGLLAALKLLSTEVAPDGVTINSVLPGRIMTARLLSSGATEAQVQDAAARDVPVGRVGSVEEIAAVATFLCSAQAAYVTGTAVPVDGGLLRGT